MLGSKQAAPGLVLWLDFASRPAGWACGSSSICRTGATRLGIVRFSFFVNVVCGFGLWRRNGFRPNFSHHARVRVLPIARAWLVYQRGSVACVCSLARARMASEAEAGFSKVSRGSSMESSALSASSFPGLLLRFIFSPIAGWQLSHIARFGVPIRVEKAAVFRWSFIWIIAESVDPPVLFYLSLYGISLWFWDAVGVVGRVQAFGLIDLSLRASFGVRLLVIFQGL